MPLYEFECQDCQTKYDDRVDIYDDTGVWPDTKCPKCGSFKKDKLLPSRVNFMFMQPEGTKVWNSSHDYRFKHNLPKVLQERQNAEMASRMGKNPYNPIDDVSSGENFGDIK